MVKEIPLTQGKVALVDDEDYERVNQHKWYARFNHGNWYAERGQWDYAIKKVKDIKMHRLIISAPKDVQVDHINGDGLDNQRCNLRIVTQSQNQRNMKKRTKRKYTSIYKGVCFDKERRKWVVSIYIDNKCRKIGRFKNEIDAARAYDEAAKKYFGEYARLNFPEIN